jgi:hypothetical protein
MARKSGAIFDTTATYRYLLWRQWDDRLPAIGFIMLNPSQADATVNDPTIRRCLGFAQRWGYGRLEVVNLFAYRCTRPGALRQVADPIGADNDRHLIALAQRVEHIILAWGNWGSVGDRASDVLSLFDDRSALFCLAVTQQGQPGHPLYLKNSQMPIPFDLTRRGLPLN